MCVYLLHFSCAIIVVGVKIGYLLKSIHIVSERIASLLASLYPSFVQVVVRFPTGYIKGSTVSSICIPTQLVRLRSLEVGEDICIGPA